MILSFLLSLLQPVVFVHANEDGTAQDSLLACPVVKGPLPMGWKTVRLNNDEVTFSLPPHADQSRDPVAKVWGFDRGTLTYIHWPSDTSSQMARPKFLCTLNAQGRPVRVGFMHGHAAATVGWQFVAEARLRNGDTLEWSGVIEDPFPEDDMWRLLGSIRIGNR